MANVRQAVSGLEEIYKNLDKLVTSRESLARAMGAAMGNAVRDEAQKRAPELQAGNEGYDNQRRGQLRDAIYNAYDGRRSVLNEGHIVYGVSWNRRKAPHGHLLEFGHWMPYEAKKIEGRWVTPIVKTAGRGKRAQGVPIGGNGFFVEAHPFLGPAFDSKLSQLHRIAAEAGKAAFAR